MLRCLLCYNAGNGVAVFLAGDRTRGAVTRKGVHRLMEERRPDTAPLTFAALDRLEAIVEKLEAMVAEARATQPPPELKAVPDER